MTFRRTALLGASTLVGKELLERLRSTHAPVGKVTLVEPGSAHAVIAAVGDELELSTPRVAEALEGADLVLACAELTKADRASVEATAGRSVVIDLAGTLGGKPFDARAGRVDLGPGVHASPAGASLLVAALARSARAAGASRVSAVVVEPASELGREALDEMYEQAVAILNFLPIPTAVLGRQLVHDITSPGPAGEVREERLRNEVARLAGGAGVPLLLVQAGVFHGAATAAWADVDPAAWKRAMLDEPRLAIGDAADASPVQTVQREDATVGRVDGDGAGGAWAWAAADTLVHGAVGNVLAWLAGVEEPDPAVGGRGPTGGKGRRQA